MNEIFSLFKKKKKKEIKGLILGLDNGGKTTILKSFKGETVLNLPPTKGFNFQKFDYNNITFILWDLGGQKSIRKFWDNYYEKENDCIIYVIDSSDSDRLEETGKELYNIIQQPELSGIPLVIYANKQDLNMALSVDEILEQLGLDEITDRKWTIIASSALTKQGLSTGLNWIIECCDND